MPFLTGTPVTLLNGGYSRVARKLHYKTAADLGGGFEDMNWRSKGAAENFQIHRADFYKILHDAVEALSPGAVRLGRRLKAYSQDADGVTVHFEGGETVRGAVLIGADGIRSTVRTQMHGPENPKFTGRVAYRFMVPMELARPYMSAGRGATYVAPGQSLLRYEIRKGTLVNCVSFAPSDAWDGEGWSQRVSNAELMSLFVGWHPDVVGLASVAPLEGTAKWGLYDRDPLDVWVDGRVALLGDAAHPMLPFLGMGAAMGIEDAVVLGRALGEAGVGPEALKIYEAARAPRAGLILEESRRQGQLFRQGPDSTERMTLTTTKERMDYDPATVPL